MLDGEPLFVTQYKMARKHWQIVQPHRGRQGGRGRLQDHAADRGAAARVVDIGVRAARLIGKGLYGVDIKKNERGVFVIEINDNPNLVHDVEDAGGEGRGLAPHRPAGS